MSVLVVTPLCISLCVMLEANGLHFVGHSYH